MHGDWADYAQGTGDDAGDEDVDDMVTVSRDDEFENAELGMGENEEYFENDTYGFNPTNMADDDGNKYDNSWMPLRLGEALISVSSLGAIRNAKSFQFQNIDYGIPYIGTPLRTVRVEVTPGITHNFFVHELVWRAFNGDIPDGWEVRHKMQALQDMDASCIASNALADIDIFAVTATKLTNALFRSLSG